MSILRSRIRGGGLAGAAASNAQTLVQTGAITQAEAKTMTAAVAPKTAVSALPAKNTTASITGSTLTSASVPTPMKTATQAASGPGMAPSSRTVLVPAAEDNAYRRWHLHRYGAQAGTAAVGKLMAPEERLVAFRVARTRVARLAAGAKASAPTGMMTMVGVATPSGVLASTVMQWWAAVDPSGQACWDAAIVSGAPARLAGSTSPPTLWPAAMLSAVRSALETAHAKRASSGLQSGSAINAAVTAARTDVVANFRPANLGVLIGLEGTVQAQTRVTIEQVGKLPVIVPVNQPVPIPSNIGQGKAIGPVTDQRIPVVVGSGTSVNQNTAADTPDPTADANFGGSELLAEEPYPTEPPPIEPLSTPTAPAQTQAQVPWLLLGGAALAAYLLFGRK